MIRQDPVLVAWTTPDYVSRLHHRYPGEIYFVVDSRFKNSRDFDGLDRTAVIFTDFEDLQLSICSIKHDLLSKKLTPAGVACFDCESLIPASLLARELELPFPDIDGILRARNKYEAGRVWKENGIPSPSVLLVSSLEESLDGFQRMQRDVVLKPVSGSGSELVFHCVSEEEVIKAVRIMLRELPLRASNPLFRPIKSPAGEIIVDPTLFWIVEEFVSGPEFSCDFFLKGERVTLIRETGKIKASGRAFGTILAYTYPPKYPGKFSFPHIRDILGRAAAALGFSWGHFMADFTVSNGRPMIIEISPRPGGDSIPDLFETATGIDLLKLHIDFVSGRNCRTEFPVHSSERLASVNLFADQNGKISRIDSSHLLNYPPVRSVFLRKKIGDRVLLPPESYDHQLLGHAIVSLDSDAKILNLSAQMAERLKVSIHEGFSGENSGGLTD